MKHEGDSPRIQAADISNLNVTFGVSRWDEYLMVKCIGDVGCQRGKSMGCGVTEGVMRNTLK